MRIRTSLIPILLCACWVATPGQAKKNVPELTLKFVPTQAVHEALGELDRAMQERAVSLRLADGRNLAEPDRIGKRTDDDDRVHQLRAVNDPVQVTDHALRKIAEEAGIRVRDDAELVLDGTLQRLEVLEKNQAVGATYKGIVSLAFELRDREGTVLWSASGTGEASRYGKKFSNDNSNEVASDALIQAFAGLLADTKLRAAWAGRAPKPGAGRTAARQAGADAPPAAALTPERLLEEIKGLMEQGFQGDTLVQFVQKQTLTRALSAGEMASWKREGIAEEVIRTALSCRVR